MIACGKRIFTLLPSVRALTSNVSLKTCINASQPLTTLGRSSLTFSTLSPLNNSTVTSSRGSLLNKYLNSVDSVQKRGLKHRGVLQLRCSGCRFVKINEIWHVTCKLRPRHKQRELITSYRDRWIMTHTTRSGKPFIKKPEAYILNNCPPGPFDYKPKVGAKYRCRKKYLHPLTPVPYKTKQINIIPHIN
ncbi:uncharacterized protein LOC141854255 [Brevipalpus obovatus]|uniref:uncharacterized protein LOC141854255 n=1 Tax=Brevipalpus obovatus TaxID=246614 RepID=UPI003D9DCA34